MGDLEKIEERVRADRSRLASSLDALTETVAPERVADQVSDVAQSYGGELGRQAWSSAKQNPAAFALVGAGLGLLFTGTGSRPEARDAPDPVAVPPEKAHIGFDARVAAADAAMKEEMTGLSDDVHRASQMRETLDRGLDQLPDAARNRVLKARQQALAAQERAEDYAKRAAATTRTFHHQQPLAVGALALGMGALIGALLPSTRREDEVLGRERDILMQKARAALNDELDQAAATADRKIRAVARRAS